MRLVHPTFSVHGQVLRCIKRVIDLTNPFSNLKHLSILGPHLLPNRPTGSFYFSSGPAILKTWTSWGVPPLGISMFPSTALRQTTLVAKCPGHLKLSRVCRSAVTGNPPNRVGGTPIEGLAGLVRARAKSHSLQDWHSESRFGTPHSRATIKYYNHNR